MRLAYADPPYPGMANLYPEKTEVDHVELVASLREYDGWALSTDERGLSYVLGLCPPGVRVLAWCKSNAPPFLPNPICSWEPVLCWPARKSPAAVRSYLVTEAPTGFRQREAIPGQKSLAFCEWVIRCMGAMEGDTLHDVFPGTGIMGQAWEAFERQPPLFVLGNGTPSHKARSNFNRRHAETFEGMEPPEPHDERATKVRIARESCGAGMSADATEDRVLRELRGKPLWCFECRKRLKGRHKLYRDTSGYLGPFWQYECDGCGRDRRRFGMP